MKNLLIFLFLPNLAFSHVGNGLLHYHFEGIFLLVLTLVILRNLFWRKYK